MRKIKVISQHLHLEEALRCSNRFPEVDIFTAPAWNAKFDTMVVIVDGDDFVEIYDAEDDSQIKAQLFAKLPKPLVLLQLISSLQELLHRSSKKHIMLAGFVFAPHSREIIDANGSRLILLTEKEALMVALLLERQDKGASKEELLQTVWGYSQDVLTNTLETHIYRLRQKLQKNNIAWQISVEANVYKCIAKICA